MSFIRTVKQENPFVQMDKRSIGGGDLSLKATGLLLYFLSKPNDWQIRLKDVEKRFKDGLDSVRSGMKELEEAGYVYKYRSRDEQGRLADWVYYVYELPEYNPQHKVKNTDTEPTQPKRDFPNQGNPKQEKPNQDNPTYSNNDLSNKDSTNNELNSSNSSNVVPFSSEHNPFETYHECYGKFPTPKITNDIQQFEQAGMEQRMICLAIEKAAGNGSGFQYALGILNNWKDKGLYTYEQAVNERKRREENKHGEHRESQDSGSQWIDTSLRNEL